MRLPHYFTSHFSSENKELLPELRNFPLFTVFTTPHTSTQCFNFNDDWMLLAISLHLRNVKRLIAEKQYNIQEQSKYNLDSGTNTVCFKMTEIKSLACIALSFAVNKPLKTSWKHLPGIVAGLGSSVFFFSARSFRSWIRAARHFGCQFLYHVSLIAISRFDHFSQAYIFCSNLFKQNNILAVHFADRRGQEWGHRKKFNFFTATYNIHEEKDAERRQKSPTKRTERNLDGGSGNPVGF